MANIAIIDTGYIKTAASGTQAGTIANSGSAINLKSVNVSYQRASNVDSTEIINTNTGPVVGFGTVTAAKITIQGVLDSGTTADMDLMQDLNDCLKTYGIKLLYYTDASDGYREITDSLGDANKNDVHKTNNFSSTTTPHLHVRVVGFQITQTSNRYLRYTLECVETE